MKNFPDSGRNVSRN